MFTVEFEYNASVITTLDQQDKFQDVQVILNEDGSVYIRQFEDALGEHQIIYMSYQQFLDIYAALSSTEGMFEISYRRE